MRSFINRALAKIGLRNKARDNDKKEEELSWKMIEQHDIEEVITDHELNKSKFDIVNFEFKYVLERTDEALVCLAQNAIDCDIYIISVFRKPANGGSALRSKVLKDVEYSSRFGLGYLHLIDNARYYFLVYSDDYLCPLSDFIRHAGKPTEPQLKLIASQVIRKLNKLHEKGLLFLNLTIETVIIDIRATFYLSCFQYVQHYSEKHDCLHREHNIDILPPDIFHFNYLDQTADLYSLGVLLYELLLGHKPIRTRDIFQYEQFMSKHSPYIKKDEIPETVSLECVDFINRLLQLNKTNRIGILRTKDCFMHPWFRKNQRRNPKTSEGPFDAIMAKLLHMEGAKMFKKLYPQCEKARNIFEDD